VAAVIHRENVEKGTILGKRIIFTNLMLILLNLYYCSNFKFN